MTNDFRKPAQIGAVTLRNRVIMGSMHTGLEEHPELSALAEFYRERAKGGAGLIITGGIAPNKAGVVFQGGAQMSRVEDAKKHEIVTDAVRAEGGKIFMQILHAGRYAITPDLVAPSAIQAPISPFTPKALSAEEVESTIEDFAQAAILAQKAGYDGVEIMGSEGYLINQFLVTHTNQREDEWGGEYPNRMRFAVEITRRIRAATGKQFGIIFRISLLDLIENGSSEEEIRTLALAIEAAGADALNSGFGWHEARIPTIAASVPPIPFLDFTKRLKSWVSIPVIAANRFYEPSQIDAAIQNESADFVAMARPFLADAHFMNKTETPAEIAPCIACNQACLDRIFSLKSASCLVNPRAGRETELSPTQAQNPQSIAVIGAGPAGLTAAITLAERGHKVTLFEAQSEIGGQLKLAAQIPGKEDFKRLLAYYETMLQHYQIPIRYEKASPSALAEFATIVIATGVRPRIPEVEGIENAVPYDVLINEGTNAKSVAIIGSGPIGFDVASLLVEKGEETVESWRENWGVTTADQSRGGLAKARAASAPRPALTSASPMA